MDATPFAVVRREFQIQAFPFRMTAANMARYRKDPNYEFWNMLKEGYDYFEITKVPPKVDVCEKRYIFNQTAGAGATFNPAGACPLTTQPNSLKVAYQSYQKAYDAAFSTAAGSSTPQLTATIGGPRKRHWSRTGPASAPAANECQASRQPWRLTGSEYDHADLPHRTPAGSGPCGRQG